MDLGLLSRLHRKLPKRPGLLYEIHGLYDQPNMVDAVVKAQTGKKINARIKLEKSKNMY